MVGRRSQRAGKVAAAASKQKEPETEAVEEEISAEDQSEMEKILAAEEEGDTVEEEDMEDDDNQEGEDDDNQEGEDGEGGDDDVQEETEDDAEPKVDEEEAKDAEPMEDDETKEEDFEVELEELLSCKICDAPCSRGVSLKCCGTQACRACATKKVTATRRCWSCDTRTKTDDLDNDESLRNAVNLHKAEKEIPGDALKELKDRYKKGLSKESSRTGQEALNPMKTDFEDDSIKIYMCIEISRTARRTFILQIGCLNSATGDTLLVPFAPSNAFCKDTELLEKLHLKETTTLTKENVFRFTCEDGKALGAYRQDPGMDRVVDFLKEAVPDDKSKLTLVFYSNNEYMDLTYRLKYLKECGKEVANICTHVVVYEKYKEMVEEKLEPLGKLLGKEDKDFYCMDKMALGLRTAFDNLEKNKDDFAIQKFDMDYSSGRKVIGNGMLIISPCKIRTDSSAFFEYNKNVPKEERRKAHKDKKKERYTLNYNLAAFFNCNTPVLFKLTDLDEGSNAVKYKFKTSLFYADGESRVFSKNNEKFAFFVMRSHNVEDKESAAVNKLTRDNIKLLKKRKTHVQYFNRQLPAAEKRKVEVVMKLNCAEAKVTVDGYYSVLVDLLPANADQDNGPFNVADTFSLLPDDEANIKVQVVSKLFCPVMDGVKTARITIKPPKLEDPVTLTKGQVIGKAILIDGQVEETIERALKVSWNQERWYEKLFIQWRGHEQQGNKRKSGSFDHGSAKRPRHNDQNRNQRDNRRDDRNRGNQRNYGGNQRNYGGNQRNYGGGNRFDGRRDGYGGNRDNRWQQQQPQQQQNNGALINQLVTALAAATQQQNMGGNYGGMGMVNRALMNQGGMNVGGGRVDPLYQREMALKQEEERLMRMRRDLEQERVTSRIRERNMGYGGGNQRNYY